MGVKQPQGQTAIVVNEKCILQNERYSYFQKTVKNTKEASHFVTEVIHVLLILKYNGFLWTKKNLRVYQLPSYFSVQWGVHTTSHYVQTCKKTAGMQYVVLFLLYNETGMKLKKTCLHISKIFSISEMLILT